MGNNCCSESGQATPSEPNSNVPSIPRSDMSSVPAIIRESHEKKVGGPTIYVKNIDAQSSQVFGIEKKTEDKS